MTKRSPPVLVPCHLGQNWSRADDLKFTTVNYYCKYDEIKKMDLAKNFEVRTYQFIMSVHCPLRVWAFEPSTIKLLCLQVVKSLIEKSKNRKVKIVLHASKICTVVGVHILCLNFLSHLASYMVVWGIKWKLTMATFIWYPKQACMKPNGWENWETKYAHRQRYKL